MAQVSARSLEALYLVDAEGNETSVKVNPGKTYLAVVDLEEAGKFSYRCV